MVEITPISITDEKEEVPIEERDEDYEDIPNEEDVSDNDVDEEADDDDDYEDDEEDILNESLADRIIALKHIVSPTYRPVLYASYSNSKAVFNWSLNAVWVIVTSAAFLGTPIAIMAANNAAGGRFDMAMQAAEAAQVIAPGAV
ncbi:mitochondrial outer membrane translocase complex, subunit Tom22 [Lipomyces oligophaga]|uniref:mitochondrial outer membrane translocase complex, subunit Tom22 n=1 Tax=Lipomyces oligophaga TaxID=45792 RepID=UPI0034CE9A85